jgi:hypothetical protein
LFRRGGPVTVEWPFYDRFIISNTSRHMFFIYH